MEQLAKEPDWLNAWRDAQHRLVGSLPESLTYSEGITDIFSFVPSFAEEAPSYRVLSIDKELELYTLKEAYETLGIADLLKGLLASPLLPAPKTKFEAIARAEVRSGLVCYIQPKIDVEGNFVTQQLSLSTTIGNEKSADIVVVIAKTGARAEIAHEFSGGSEKSMLARFLIILAEEGAEVTFLDSAYSMAGAVAVERIGLIGSSARIDLQEEVTASCAYRTHTHNIVAGENAKTKINHLLFANKHAKYDISAVVDVYAANAQTLLLAHGVAGSDGHIIYQGNSIARASAKELDANEDAQFLLLDESSRIDAIPAQEVRQSVVNVTHKLKITHVSEEVAFFAQSRGLSSESARAIAVESFFGEIGATAQFIKIMREIIKKFF